MVSEMETGDVLLLLDEVLQRNQIIRRFYFHPDNSRRRRCSETMNHISVTFTLFVIIEPYYPSRTLCSQNTGLLVVPRVSISRTGGRAFSSHSGSSAVEPSSGLGPVGRGGLNPSSLI